VFPEGHFAQYVISVLVLLCSTNSTYATTQGNPMIWYSMARDGLLPARFSAVDKNNTPQFSIICTGALMTCISGLFDFNVIAGATTSAVLLVQGLVCVGCLLDKLNSQNEYRVRIKVCLTMNIFATVACAGFYGENSNTTVQWFLAAIAAVSALFVISWSKTYSGLVPLISATINFFLVGVSGFWALAQLCIIFAAFSVLYFSYGVSHSKLAS
jgi:APA family basic amino acid/polyamine antiporter